MFRCLLVGAERRLVEEGGVEGAQQQLGRKESVAADSSRPINYLVVDIRLLVYIFIMIRHEIRGV